MEINWQLVSYIVTIAAGIMIFIKPKLLSYIVAAYLVFVGVVGLLNELNML